jgi:hypothetical protein
MKPPGSSLVVPPQAPQKGTAVQSGLEAVQGGGYRETEAHGGDDAGEVSEADLQDLVGRRGLMW